MKINETVAAAMELTKVILTRDADIKEDAERLLQFPDTDIFIGGINRGVVNSIPQTVLAFLTTKPSRWYNHDDDYDDGEPELIVRLAASGENSTSFSGGERAATSRAKSLAYLKEYYTCWELNQLFSHDGKFEDLPKHIEALLA